MITSLGPVRASTESVTPALSEMLIPILTSGAADDAELPPSGAGPRALDSHLDVHLLVAKVRDGHARAEVHDVPEHTIMKGVPRRRHGLICCF